jgi:uncharacterized SAM-binding protein YcdF (DUF218 family)
MHLILVLSGPGVEIHNGIYHPCSILKGRLDRAIEIWKNDREAFFMMTGGDGDGQRNEPSSRIMARYVYDKLRSSINPFQILEEPRALNTFDNAIYSRNLICVINRHEGVFPFTSDPNVEKKSYGKIDKITLVTSDFHLPRCKKIFGHYFPNYDIDYQGTSLYHSDYDISSHVHTEKHINLTDWFNKYIGQESRYIEVLDDSLFN